MAQSKPLNVLITGGARGIGRGLFRHFVAGGHKVLILDSNEVELGNTAKLGEEWARAKTPHPFRAEHCDLSDRAQIKKAVDTATSLFDGKLDVLINNAIPTGFTGKAMEETSDDVMEDWDLKVAVGLTAPFLLSRLCVPLLQAQDGTSRPGCIINMSSTRAYQAEADHESYSAVKAGILGLTQSMAVSLGHRHKIRVNAILPGWIHVLNESKAADDEHTKWEEGFSKEDEEWHPAGRVGKVDDIVKAVEYLIHADFVTGQEVVVDGGVTRKMVYPE